jgi:quinol monooxygenase YgiN
MSDPIVYVSTWRLRPDKVEAYRRFYAELVRVIDANEPQVAAFLAFANEDQTEVTNVHVYPDAETLDRHMQVLGEQMGLMPDDLTSVMEFLEPVRVAVLGRPAGPAAAMDQGLMTSGVPFDTKGTFVGGFTRVPA